MAKKMENPRDENGLITSLTPEQEAKMQEYVDRYVAIGWCCDPIDREAVQPYMNEFYPKILNRRKPLAMSADSPLQAWHRTTVVSFLELRLLNHIRSMIGDTPDPLEYDSATDSDIKYNRFIQAEMEENFPKYIDTVMLHLISELSECEKKGVQMQLFDTPLEKDKLTKLKSAYNGRIRSGLKKMWKAEREEWMAGIVKDMKEYTKNPAVVFPYITGAFDSNFFGLYDFMRDEVGVTGYPELYDLYRGVMNFGPIYTLENVCIVSDRPRVKIFVDDRHRLHNEDGPAVQYCDGYKIYSVGGVRVPEYVIETPEKITLNDIQDEQNQEVKRIMIDKYGTDKWLKDMGAKTIDQATEGGGFLTELLLAVHGNQRQAFYKCMCPSTGREYCLEVPPDTKSCREASQYLSDGKDAEYEVFGT